jgi:hypothetical protein
MKNILIENITDSDHARIEAALMTAYKSLSLEASLRHFINSTVKNMEESEIRKTKDDETQIALDNIVPVTI